MASTSLDTCILGCGIAFRVARATIPTSKVEESTAYRARQQGRWPQRIGHVVVCVSDILFEFAEECFFCPLFLYYF